MNVRLQVVMDEKELADIRETARRHGMSVSECVRQTLRQAQRRESGAPAERKLAAVRTAAMHDFPTAEVEDTRAEIERGYLSP